MRRRGETTSRGCAETPTSPGASRPWTRVTAMPGVGAIGQICVVPGSPAGSAVVTFKPPSGPYALAHVSGPAAPLHQCALALGAAWFEVTSMNLTRLDCPHGYRLIRSP